MDEAKRASLLAMKAAAENNKDGKSAAVSSGTKFPPHELGRPPWSLLVCGGAVAMGVSAALLAATDAKATTPLGSASTPSSAPTSVAGSAATSPALATGSIASLGAPGGGERKADGSSVRVPS